MTAPRVALDASALLAFLRGEPGAEAVRALRREAAISVVNVAETLQVLIRIGFSSAEAMALVRETGVRIEPFDQPMPFARPNLKGRPGTPDCRLGIAPASPSHFASAFPRTRRTAPGSESMSAAPWR